MAGLCKQLTTLQKSWMPSVATLVVRASAPVTFKDKSILGVLNVSQVMMSLNLPMRRADVVFYKSLVYTFKLLRTTSFSPLPETFSLIQPQFLDALRRLIFWQRNAAIDCGEFGSEEERDETVGWEPEQMVHARVST